ncbi:MAG TPA: maleylpyruvate isomerase family mycothiol-dependent enzyme [Candidatus Dormibacteraeota bacterium]|nr:maleylpyruvate isomerase family mycothiol-dependent enzyme [Candidatus Dormibacteraeota bacterium]
MANTDLWSQIHAERRALAADLESLDDQGWATPSLCQLWSVRDVLGHLVAAAKMTPPKFIIGLAGAGFRFNAMTAKDVARETAGPVGDTLIHFRSLITATSHPPGPVTAMLGEAVLHGEDIRRPLGIHREYPVETLTGVANFFKGSNLLLGSKRRIAGLTLQATDVDWSWGVGPEVRGPLSALLLAMTGRPAGLDDLAGAGLATLKPRM